MIRSTLPQMDLDDIFSSQDTVALELHRSLNGNMNKYGFTIHHALLTKIDPDENVRYSMNEIQASKKFKEACPHKAEAARIECVKEAEGRAERAYLNGVGVARERREIVKGMKRVVDDASGTSGSAENADISSVSSKGVMDLLLLTQYFDLLTNLNGFGRKDHNSVRGNDDSSDVSASLIVAHMPEAVFRLQEQVRECFEYTAPIAVPVENLLDLS